MTKLKNDRYLYLSKDDMIESVGEKAVELFEKYMKAHLMFDNKNQDVKNFMMPLPNIKYLHCCGMIWSGHGSAV